MVTFRTGPNGWLSVPVSPKREEEAMEMRAARDREYPNRYPERRSDARWVGELGEMVFNAWLEYEHIPDVQWIVNDPVRKPDFVTNHNISIGVKTVKRNVPLQAHYTAQITAEHDAEPVDYFFFMNYEIAEHRMWLLGGIERKRFLEEAQFHAAGEPVHSNYTPLNHDIYNIEIMKLVPPKDWLVLIK